MKRVGHIFWREYWGNITRRSYLFFTFGFPLFMITVPIVGGIALGLAIQSALPATDPRPVGMIDQVQILDGAVKPDHPVDVIFFPNTNMASQALKAGEIQAYYDIQADYWTSGEVVATYELAPAANIDRMVGGWIESRIRANAPPDILARIDRGPNISHHGLVTERTVYAESDVIEPIMVYLVIYFVRLAGSFTASYMFDSIASEGEDRTLEIMITTVSPLQFVIGKLFGLLAVGLTQIGMWIGAIGIIAVGIGLLLGLNLLDFLLTWEHLGLMLSVLLAAYLLDQILAAAMGLLRVSGGAGNLLFSTLNAVVGISLIYAAYFVPRNPHAPLAIVASLIPITAPLVLLIRVVVSSVPLWQIILSQILLWGSCAAGIFWLQQLLKINLLNNRGPFQLRSYLKERLSRLPAAGRM